MKMKRGGEFVNFTIVEWVIDEYNSLYKPYNKWWYILLLLTVLEIWFFIQYKAQIRREALDD